MSAFAAVPFDRGGRPTVVACHRPDRTVRHELIAEGRVRIILPRSGEITDAQARRLAWALLADLAPDEVEPVPEFVTYKEAQRLAVLRAVAAGARTARDIAGSLDWTVRQAQRRLIELVGDGRLAGSSAGRGKGTIHYSQQLARTGD